MRFNNYLYHYLCEAVLMSSFKNNFECEATLLSTNNTTACIDEIRTKFDLG